MSVTSSSNASLLPPVLCFTNTSIYPKIFSCFDYTPASSIFTVFTAANLLLFPLYSLILWDGFQRWHQSSAPSKTSHSDVFTYCMVFMEIISVLGAVFYFCSIYTCDVTLKMLGYFSFTVTYPGLTFFHCLSCVERYLAVVHPITYRRLRQVGGVRIRNISIACVCLLSLGVVGLTLLYFPKFPSSVFFAILGIAIFVVFFCSLSVLRVLIRLGLGKVGGVRERIDQSKIRAFQFIVAITGVLVLRSCGLTVCNIVFDLESVAQNACVTLMSGVWLCLPSSLVLPVLFLLREGSRSGSSST